MHPKERTLKAAHSADRRDYCLFVSVVVLVELLPASAPPPVVVVVLFVELSLVLGGFTTVVFFSTFVSDGAPPPEAGVSTRCSQAVSSEIAVAVKAKRNCFIRVVTGCLYNSFGMQRRRDRHIH